MHESAGRHLETLVTLDTGLKREFEDWFRESSSLAVRVRTPRARQRQDTETVAHEALAKACSRFPQLRNRMPTWRLASTAGPLERRRTARGQSGVPEGRTDGEGIAAENRGSADQAASDDLPDKLGEAVVVLAIQG
jgi:hypothetical protein